MDHGKMAKSESIEAGSLSLWEAWLYLPVSDGEFIDQGIHSPNASG